MPMRLDEGWNQIQFNLSDFTRRACVAAPGPGARLRQELHVQGTYMRGPGNSWARP